MIINFQKNSNHSILNIQNEKRQSDKLIIIEFKQFKRLSDTIVIKEEQEFSFRLFPTFDNSIKLNTTY